MKIKWTELRKKSKAQTLVLFVQQIKTDKKNETQAVCPAIPKVLKNFFDAISDSKGDKSITGKLGEALLFRSVNQGGFQNLIFIGLGKFDKQELEPLRLAGGYLESCLGSITEAVVDINTLNDKVLPEMVQALSEGLLLADYRFDELKSKKEDEKSREKHLEFSFNGRNEEFETATLNAHLLVECVNFSKRLGDMPGNLMTPSILAQETKKAGKSCGLKVTVWDKARITKEKMGGLLGVAQGSIQEPKFIIMEYHGSKNKNEKPIVFVGKGLTFDSGGISLKPSASMEEMKYDMCGGANVIGTMLAITKLKLKVNVVGLVPTTENMPGHAATKPGDVHTGRNGKTFEVNNTDAEGRLILADALSYASDLKPKMIIDAATLTGAIVIALGNSHTGFFTRNNELKRQIDEAALASGEWVWQMPLCDHHTKDIKGTYADISNISSFKGAGSATAAAFLEHFVDKDIPWAHFDIAGTGWGIGNRLSYCGKKGASGVMVRTFVELAKLFQN
jgi:leucyl aminopeptidase